jgi:hypothetical protein
MRRRPKEMRRTRARPARGAEAVGDRIKLEGCFRWCAVLRTRPTAAAGTTAVEDLAGAGAGGAARFRRVGTRVVQEEVGGGGGPEGGWLAWGGATALAGD